MTHISTGRSVYHVQTEGEALRIARHLDEKESLPAGEAEMLHWLDHVSPKDKMQLLLRLADVAPVVV